MDKALDAAAARNHIGVLKVVKALLNNRTHARRLHRQYKTIGESVHTCMDTLNQSSSLDCMKQVQEHESNRYKVCKTANDWPRKEQKPQKIGDDPASAGVLFVLSSYVSDNDNARTVALSLASIIVHHPAADILIVDQQSPLDRGNQRDA